MNATTGGVYIVMSPANAVRFQRRLHRQYRGEGGIMVRATDDVVTIALAHQGRRDVGPRAGIQSAKLIAVPDPDNSSALRGKLVVGLNEQGQEVVAAQEITIKVSGASMSGAYSETLDLAQTNPQFAVNDVIKLTWDVIYQAWYWVGNATETCPPD